MCFRPWPVYPGAPWYPPATRVTRGTNHLAPRQVARPGTFPPARPDPAPELYAHCAPRALCVRAIDVLCGSAALREIERLFLRNANTDAPRYAPHPFDRHGSRGVPALRARGGRPDRRLPGGPDALAGPGAGRAGRAAPRAPGEPALVTRADGGDPRRRRARRAPRDDALEPPRLPRLLRDHGLGTGDPGRDVGCRTERERDAVADRPGCHGARGSRPRLAASAPRAPRGFRGDDQRHGLLEHPLRTRRSAR